LTSTNCKPRYSACAAPRLACTGGKCRFSTILSGVICALAIKWPERVAALVFFSTYTIDKLPQGGMDFWYIAPRNGHITIYTEKSLQQLFSRFELSVHHFGNGYHLAYRELPEWVNLDVFSVIHRRGRVRRYLKKLKSRLSR